MATGRTHPQWQRIYVAGYDISGSAQSAGPLALEFAEHDLTTLTDAVMGFLPGQPKLTPTAVNAVMDNTAAIGLHTAFGGASGVRRTVTVAIGIRAAPAQGDPTYNGEFEQSGYTAKGQGPVAVNMPFGFSSIAGNGDNYPTAWGPLLHARVAETAVNAAIGVDDNGGQSTRGGFMTYHLISSNGTVTLKVQDASTNTNPSFADLAGATSGAVDATTTPQSAIVPLGVTATVRQFLRWQLVFGTATTATFILTFVRG